MPPLQITRSQFKISDFLGWQREGSLRLSPSFQRRAVWKADAKSFLVDTVVRGLPTPVIFIRERVDLDTQRTLRLPFRASRGSYPSPPVGVLIEGQALVV